MNFVIINNIQLCLEISNFEFSETLQGCDDMEIGKNIQQRRILLGLTQQELANRCELTKGYISQLENDKTSPSIETLTQILKVLGVSISEFFAEEDKSNIVFTQDEYYEKDFSNYKQIWLVPTSQINQMEPIIVEMEPYCCTTLDLPHNGEEFGYVLEGEIIIHYGDSIKICKKGESFYYVTNKQHYLENKTNMVAKVIWVSCPPQF